MAEFEKLDPNAPRGPAEIPSLAAADKRPDVQIDRSKIVDVYGNPLKYGKDPNDRSILGPDDDIPAVKQDLPPGSLRDRSLYPSLFPATLFLAEERYVLPMAQYVANSIVDVDLIDEKTYAKLQPQLKERSIFCVLDISAPEVHSGMVRWPGFRVVCKQFDVATVYFQLDLGLNLTITTHVRVWESQTQRYMNLGDRSFLKDLTREKAAEIIDNYLVREGILK